MVSLEEHSRLREFMSDSRVAGTGYVTATHYSVLISYDAANVYGTMLRDTATCESRESYIGRPGDHEINRFLIKVNGLTNR